LADIDDKFYPIFFINVKLMAFVYFVLRHHGRNPSLN